MGETKELKVIVAGGRDFNNKELVRSVLNEFADAYSEYDVKIVSGMARGADRIAYELSLENAVMCYEFPADWDTHGKGAGFIRNKSMAEFADYLIAFWDGESRGTKHMIETMWNLNKPVSVVRY